MMLFCEAKWLMIKMQAHHQTLDLCHLQCPMTLLQTKQALSELDCGQILHLQLPNQAACHDIVKYIKKTRYELLHKNTTNKPFQLIIQKSL